MRLPDHYRHQALVFGASTDYALQIIARHREEAATAPGMRQPVRAAVRRSFESIIASAGTVILGLVCLLLGELSSNRGLGRSRRSESPRRSWCR